MKSTNHLRCIWVMWPVSEILTKIYDFGYNNVPKYNQEKSFQGNVDVYRSRFLCRNYEKKNLKSFNEDVVCPTVNPALIWFSRTELPISHRKIKYAILSALIDCFESYSGLKQILSTNNDESYRNWLLKLTN